VAVATRVILEGSTGLITGVAGVSAGASPWISAMLIGCGALIAGGSMTRVAPVLLSAFQLGLFGYELWMVGLAAFTMGTHLSRALDGVMLAGYALIGPGAYSLDAHFFDQREIVISPRTYTPPK
jgi:hypothetical protein